MFSQDIVKEDDIKSLKKAGVGGQGDVFFLSKEFVIKKFPKFKVGDHAGGQEITQTAV
jgi:hypothetical protein